MSDWDVLIRGGTVVLSKETVRLDIGIQDGWIAALELGLKGKAREEINASHLYVIPGVIDAHVHFNEPGRTEWEGIETGSKAFVAGGGTTFFDMPLNSHPPTTTAAAFEEKRKIAEQKSYTDFALWGGLIDNNVDQMEALANCGVIGFKAFMTESGISDFPKVNDKVLLQGMKKAAELKKIVAVHAESDAITRQLAQERISSKRTSIKDYLESRPVEAEFEAIRKAIALAEETGCALHIVHVSCGSGVIEIAKARARGVDVTCETCPHYLFLQEEDVLRLGAVAKCAPPLRSTAEQKSLWENVASGRVDTIGSDHSPAPKEMKMDSNFFNVWGGISGVQHLLPLLMGEGIQRSGLSPAFLSRLISENVAKRFHLPYKGRIELQTDADFALVDMNAESTVREEGLFYRHRLTPYLGRKLQCRVMRTLVRGRTVFREGKIVSNPFGRLIKPEIRSFYE